MIYIIILKLFFIRYRDDNYRIKPEDIILKNNPRYITLNHYTDKSKDEEMEECYYMVKDTFLKGERFIYFHFSIKKNSFREKTEYITKTIFTTDQFEELQYIYENATKNKPFT